MRVYTVDCTEIAGPRDFHETIAREMNFDYFTTTLTISPLKNAGVLNEIGGHFADLYKVKWLSSDFKKKEGYKRSIVLSAEHNLYRQNYCGCIFSKRRAEENG